MDIWLNPAEPVIEILLWFKWFVYKLLFNCDNWADKIRSVPQRTPGHIPHRPRLYSAPPGDIVHSPGAERGGRSQSRKRLRMDDLQ